MAELHSLLAFYLEGTRNYDLRIPRKLENKRTYSDEHARKKEILQSSNV